MKGARSASNSDSARLHFPRQDAGEVPPRDVLARVKRFHLKTAGVAKLASQDAFYAPRDFYRPVELVISAANECRVLCRACALSTVSRGSRRARRLPRSTIFELLDEAAALGFISYLCSFEAEPFENLDLLADTLKRYRGILDASKINTNCLAFDSVGSAVGCFRRLRDIGWVDTRFVVPVLSLSVGIQQDLRNAQPVPVSHIVNGVVAFHQVFAHLRDAVLGISHYYADDFQKQTLRSLRSTVQSLTGIELHDLAVVKSREVIAAGRATRALPLKPLPQAVNAKDCLGPSCNGEFLSPTLEVDAQGAISRRAFCCRHHLGYYPSTSLATAIARVNGNPFFQLHHQGGTRLIYERLRTHVPEIQERRVRDGHHACGVLYRAAETSGWVEHLGRDAVLMGRNR